VFAPELALLSRAQRTVVENRAKDAGSAGQPVITRGAYRWVRHPAYIGGILMFAGIGVALASWGSFAILVVAAIVVYGYRVRVEERALVQTIGEPYGAYMKTHKRLVPFVV
jgi:protein-S-isoprenylcysteine O-methyltransferase Ste14